MIIYNIYKKQNDTLTKKNLNVTATIMIKLSTKPNPMKGSPDCKLITKRCRNVIFD